MTMTNEQNVSAEQTTDPKPKRKRKTIAQIRAEITREVTDELDARAVRDRSILLDIIAAEIVPGGVADDLADIVRLIAQHNRRLSSKSYIDALRDVGIPDYVITAIASLEQSQASAMVRLHLETVKHCEAKAVGKAGTSADVKADVNAGGPVYVSPSNLTDEEMDFIRRGSPIDAIKSVRSRTGLGLMESKAIVDAAMARR